MIIGPNAGTGGIIGPANPTAPRPSSNPLGGGAPGLFSIDEVRKARNADQWPVYYNATVNATGGTKRFISTPSGTYVVHEFTSTSSFVVTSSPPTQIFEYVVVGGGGGGGAAGVGGQYTPPGYYTYAGAGGGGGHRTGTFTGVSSGTFPVTIGAGGGGGGGQGTDSVLGLPAPIVGSGGGAGGSSGGNGANGGSGGGGSSISPDGSSYSQGVGGSGNVPPFTPAQGYPGVFLYAGGAAGAATPGANGAGVPYGTGWYVTPVTVGAGGVGATANQGGGGGYGYASFSGGPGGPGGPGVILIRYLQGGVG